MTQLQETSIPIPIPVADEVDEITFTEFVARTIAGISLIGHARTVLERAGWDATIVANRITVNGIIEAHLISVKGSMWWNVYSCDGSPPTFTVGAQQHEESNWIGCVE